MKKRFLTMLVLLLTLALTLVLVSCGDTESDKNGNNDGNASSSTSSNNDGNTNNGGSNGDNTSGGNNDGGNTNGGNTNGGNTNGGNNNGGNNGSNSGNDDSGKTVSVTKEEWMNAFNLVGVNSFTCTYADTVIEDGEEETRTGTLLYGNGLVFDKYIDPGYSDTFEFMDCNYENVDCMSQIFSGCGCEILRSNDFDQISDYGYSLFTYDNDAGAYIYSVDSHGGTASMSISFNENKLLKTIKGTRTEDDEVFISTANFSKYNSTNVSMPVNEMQGTVNKLIANLQNNCIIETDPVLPATVSMDTLRAKLIEFLNSIKYNNAIEFERTPSESFVIDLGGIDISFGDDATLYDCYYLTISYGYPSTIIISRGDRYAPQYGLVYIFE